MRRGRKSLKMSDLELCRFLAISELTLRNGFLWIGSA